MFRACKLIANLLKSTFKFLPINRDCEFLTIAEQHRFEFVQHDTWSESSNVESGTQFNCDRLLYRPLHMQRVLVHPHLRRLSATRPSF